MNKQTIDLQTLYAKSAIAKGFLDHFADRQNNASETTVDSMITILERQGLDPNRSAIIEIFRDLESIGVGRFVVGRKQHVSRFFWSSESRGIGRQARSEVPSADYQVDVAPSVSVAPGSSSRGFVSHPYLLRPGVQIAIDLPTDLNQTEATRIAEFIKTLPFDR